METEHMKPHNKHEDEARQSKTADLTSGFICEIVNFIHVQLHSENKPALLLWDTHTTVMSAVLICTKSPKYYNVLVKCQGVQSLPVNRMKVRNSYKL